VIYKIFHPSSEISNLLKRLFIKREFNSLLYQIFHCFMMLDNKMEPVASHVETLTSSRYQPEYQPRGDTHRFHTPPAWSHSPPPGFSQSANHVEILTASTYHLRGVTHLLQVSARIPTTRKYLSREPVVTKTKARPDYSSAPTQLALCLRFASMYKAESCYVLQPSMTR
jgi:hypothetical protein